MLKRKIYDQLVCWKNNSNGTTALLIDGARRVGKSYIAEEFAKQEYKSHIIIDFGNAPQDILDLFVNDSSDLDLFFAKLSAFYATKLYQRESLIVFDEVQQYPRARQLIKYLVADGRYDFLETGSLIRLKKNVQDIIIPSEEEHIEMFPMDFEEFLWAMGDEVTAPLIKQCFDAKKPLGQALHRKIMNDFRQYLLVGGMPQSVLAYLNGKDFEASDTAKRRILKLYRDDVSKFAAGYEDKVFAVFDGIPGQLSKKEKKYQLSSLSKSARFRTYEDSFIWLNEAMVVNTCFTQAVETLIGRTAAMPSVFHAPRPEPPRKLLMPELNGNTNAVTKYLMGRGIHPEIIDYCVAHRLLFETKRYHNAVFVGYDREGQMRYAALRGTMGNFKGEVTGSDKHYSFSIAAPQGTGRLHLFEAAIDAMSYATLCLTLIFWMMTERSTQSVWSERTTPRARKPQPRRTTTPWLGWTRQADRPSSSSCWHPRRS